MGEKGEGVKKKPPQTGNSMVITREKWGFGM